MVAGCGAGDAGDDPEAMATTGDKADDGDDTGDAPGIDDGDGDTGSADAGDAGDTDPADSGDPEDPDDPSPDDPDDAPRYSQVRQKSAHNAYQRHEAIIDQLVYHQVRSIELDIHVDQTFDDPGPGDWLVYHQDILDDETQCRLLSDCLEDLGAFADAWPEHEVVTLWIDVKDDWDGDHTPADLDAIVQAQLGSVLFSPDDLRDACPAADSLADASVTCGWPSTTALRGRVIVALTGGDVASASTPLGRYATEGTTAFVAPSIADATALDEPHPDVAIYNTNVADVDVAAMAAAAGFVVRAWGIEDAAQWAEAEAAGVHHLATDFVNAHQDPWAVTASGDWPFACIDCTTDATEPGDRISVEVDSGDIWNGADEMWFAHDAAAADGSWEALVSSANSHVEPFAKGCLMARAGLESGAPYVAVCRPADEEPVRVQVREQAGGSTVAFEDDIVDADDREPPGVAWLRLEVSDDGRCATGYGAARRGDWVEIASACVSVPLTHQGLAASSHDAGNVRFVFADPTRDGTDVSLGGLTQAQLGGAVANAQ